MPIWSPENEEQLIFLVGLTAAIVLLIINIPLLWIIKKTWNASLINKLIGLDCLIALLHIPFVLNAANIIEPPCSFR